MLEKNIHLIFKTHLDIGFTHYAARVRDNYHNHFLPLAIETGEYLWQENANASMFIWTTGAWLIHEHLETGTAAQRKNLENAIEKGIVSWHALPFTTHTELLSANLFRAGLGYSQDLDRWFGRKTTGAKMTDVPGHTLGIVPLLAEAGVRFLHIGVNSASTVPDVPPIFRWRAANGDEIVVMYQNDYGATYFPDGMDDGIAFAHTADNIGPQSISQVIESHCLLADAYPSANIYASTLTEFADVAWNQRHDFPIVDNEIADSWIHGIGTSPIKVARFLALRRLYDDWVRDGITPQRQEFGRRLTMIAEHTWGVDIKTFLRDESAWDRQDFERARQSDARFLLTEKSWLEQDDLIDTAIQSLNQADHALATKVAAASTLEPSTCTLTKQNLLSINGGELIFDQQSGGLSGIGFPNGHSLSIPDGMFAVLSYESYDAQDYQDYLKSYLTHRYHWAVQDHTKPGLETAATARSEVFFPHWQGAATCEKNLHAIARYKYDTVAAHELGAPQAPEIHYRFTDNDTLQVTVYFFDKPANRMPEASFLSFAPELDRDSWRFKKMGYSINPKSVIDNGNKQLHAVESVEAAVKGELKLTITPLDCPLVGPADVPFLPFYRGAISMNKGVRFNLHNNKWGTNFPMWYGGNSVFRFDIGLQSV